MPKSNDKTQFQSFRRLAIEDPRNARTQFLMMLKVGGSELDNFLQKVSAPGEGRLRQLIANAVRNHNDKNRLIKYLISWKKVETDEFAKRAIIAALEDVDIDSIQSELVEPLSLTDPQLVTAYRYASDRLQHRVRNAFMRPQTHIIQLREQINNINDESIRTDLTLTIGRLVDAFQPIDRILESFDVGDEHFKMKSVSICNWLKQMNVEYGRQHKQIVLNFHFDPQVSSEEFLIQANDYLLSTVFWNIWDNVQQVSEHSCLITVHINEKKESVELVIVDNGDGFNPKFLEIAFHERYSEKGENRGRGLLEIQDAVQRLHGKARLVKYQLGEYRIKLSFPLIHL